MAANLAKEGFAVRSFDLNGTGSSSSVQDAAAGAELLITMLPGTRDWEIAQRPAQTPGPTGPDAAKPRTPGTLATSPA